MKKRIVLLLMISLLLAVGCGSASPDTTVTTEADAPLFVPKPLVTRNTPPSDYVTRSVAFFDGGDVAFLYGKCDVDYYQKGRTDMMLLSRHPLNTDEIQITLPAENDYTVLFFDHTPPAKAGEAGAGCFPFYVYQNYQDIDFSRPLEDKEREAQEAAFLSLRPEDLPEVYAYAVDIQFGALQYYDENMELHILPNEDIHIEETITEMEITLGGETLSLDIGELRLHPKTDNTGSPYPFRFLSNFQMPLNGSAMHLHQFYNKGAGGYTFEMPDVLAEDTTILSMRLVSPSTELLTIMVRHNGMEYEWDGKSPIYGMTGDSLALGVIYKSTAAAELWHNIVLDIVMEYETEEGIFSLRSSNYASPRMMNIYELFAVVMDGVDMESYYENYYYKTVGSYLQAYR